jgi:hypothetical protein
VADILVLLQVLVSTQCIPKGLQVQAPRVFGNGRNGTPLA